MTELEYWCIVISFNISFLYFLEGIEMLLSSKREKLYKAVRVLYPLVNMILLLIVLWSGSR